MIDEIIFSVGSETLAQLEDVFLLCDEEGVRTRVAVDFFPHVNSEVYLERLGFTPLLTFSAAPHDEIRLLVKRATDVAIAAAGLVVLLPLHDRRGAAGAADVAGTGHLQTGPLRTERPPVSLLQIPVHVRGGRTDEGGCDALEHAQDGHEDPGRSAAYHAWAAICASSRSTNGRSCGTC